jgi:hypothetical protein
MPPRNRKPADTTVQKPAFSNADADQDAPAVEPKTRAARRPSVKAEDAMVLGDFAVSTGAPAVTRKRARENPFLDIVGKSYEANQEAADTWTRFLTAEDAADNQVRLIRAAAALLNIGSAVRVGAEDTNTNETAPEGQVFVFFRGQEQRKRDAKTAE